MQELSKFTQYEDFKQAFDREYRKQVDGYIRMGYLLKVARDTNILHSSGYKTIAEFAWNEYRLRDDAVSRMIAVNDRFSDGGYSEQLADAYKGYGASLLAEMVTLSDAVIDALPDGTTRETIREVKKEVREEGKITELEVLLEGQDERQADMESNLAKVLHQYYRDNSREYPALHKAVTAMEPEAAEEAVLLLAPSGVGVKFARVKGMGKFMLSIKGRDQQLELLNVRENETELYSWSECYNAMRGLCPDGKAKKAWEVVYGEPYPEDAKLAPAQIETAPPTHKEEESQPPKLGAAEPEADKTASEAAEEPEKEQAEELELMTETEAELKPEHQEAPEEPENREGIMDEPQTPPAETDDVKNTDTPKTLVNTNEVVVQQSIDSFPEVLPNNYIKCHDGTEVEETEEHRLWTEATEHAERLLNTLVAGEWPVDIKILREMNGTAEELLKLIQKMESMAGAK